MRKCLLLIVLLTFVLFAFAQDLHLLQQQYQSAKSAKDKIYALDALANHFTWTLGEDSLAEMYGNRQISVASETGNQELLAAAYTLNGIRLIQSVPTEKKFHRAKEYFYKAIKIGKDNGLPFYVASAYLGLSRLPYYGFERNGDMALQWANEALSLSTSIGNDSLRVLSLIAVAVGNKFKKDNVAAFKNYFEALQLAEGLNDSFLLSYCYRAISDFYHHLDDDDKQLRYMQQAEQVLANKKDPSYHDLYWLYFVRQNTAEYVYIGRKGSDKQREGNFRKARVYADKCQQQAKTYRMPDFYQIQPLVQYFWLYRKEGDFAKAMELVNNPQVERFFRLLHWQYWFLYDKARIYWKAGAYDSAAVFFPQAIGQKDSALKWVDIELHRDYGTFLGETGQLQRSIEQLETAKTKSEESKDLNNLAACYLALDNAYHKAGNMSKAYVYAKRYQQLKDSLHQLSNEKGVALLEVEREQKKLEQEQREKQALADYRSRVRTYALFGGVIVLLIIAGILWRNNRQKQKANAVLKKQKTETEQQRAKAEQALVELKTTQTQLVQREKMASLGELTAGIAHEIQNPLNFVNNFSEVNTELIQELKQENRAGKSNEVDTIADEIEQNLQKITHHGKRADAIVKGMLQHSRNSTGKKEPTNINVLADEYLRLAYQSARTKDKSFNAQIETHFDDSIGNIDIVPQEIGRVLLNLFNNALYAVCVKKQQLNGTYEPVVSVSTKKENGSVIISVRDNGNGISQKVIDKIYQPFFTTKPTGEGTGLGLSLSYDIITKGHGGELKVNTKEGEYTEFIVQLPA